MGDRAKFLKRWILNGACPLCLRLLDSDHSVAQIASCNFPGPNPENGFLEEVKARNWSRVVNPFDRLASMDLMSCDVIRCREGLALILWVEVDQGIGGDQYLVYKEEIESADLVVLNAYVELIWEQF
jgi:hypothetical protein